MESPFEKGGFRGIFGWRLSKITWSISKINAGIPLLTFLFLLSLGLRLYLLFEFPHVVFLHEADAMGYFAIAKSILTTWGLGDTSVHFPPFYPLVIGIASLFTGEFELAGRVASCLMGALLVFPVYLIGRELYSKNVGYLSAIVVIFFSDSIDYSLQPVTQTTYLTLLMAGVYIGIILIARRTLILFFLLGLICGALYLTRPEGLLFFIYISIVIFISVLLDSKTALREKIKAISLIFTGFIILALPYINYIHNQTGMWTISGKTAAAFITMDGMAKLLPSGETVGASIKSKMGIFDYYPSITAFLKAYWGNLIQYAKLVPDRFSLIYLLIAFLGMITSVISVISSRKDANKTKALQMCVILGCFVVVLPVFIFNISKAPSYILPISPILIIWLSKGLSDIEGLVINVLTLAIPDKLGKIKQWPFASAAIILFFSYSSFMPVWKSMSSEGFRYFAASQKFFLKDTGDWLKYNTPKEAVVMSRWSNMGYYGDRKWTGLVDGEIPEVIKYAREHKVSYIIIDSDAVPRRRPKLEPLLNPTMHHFGLIPVYVVENYSILVIIYKVL